MRPSLLLTICGIVLLAPQSSAAPNPLEASIEDLQAWMSDGQISAVQLVEWYHARIEAYDQQGPTLNAIQHTNDKALTQAQALDDERKVTGPRSPLHGIPVLIKDNYETIDAPTTAGSAIIDGHWPKQDATQVARLKQAGAIILGKTTMHEFAYGWTTRGSAFGATRNPYGVDRHPGGSSGGTGAAVAANFAAAGMGSDTCGSIRVPSAHNNLVGLRGTQGLSSRQGIVPLSSSRDIGGPLARSTRDLAIMLDATVGYDALDPQTTESFGKVPESYVAALQQVDLRAFKVGVLADWFGDQAVHAPVNDRIETVLKTLAKAGVAVERLSSQALQDLRTATSSPAAFYVDDYDLKRDLTAYLQQYPELPVQSFAEVVATERLEPTVANLWTNLLDPEFDSRTTYLERHEDGRRLRKQLLTLFNELQVDVLVYPTATQEAVLLNAEQTHFNCKLAAASGLPAISVPAGFGGDDMPVAIELLAEPWAEQKLLNLAYTIEQLLPVRRLPRHTPAL
jgi:Asp-tRNA(Asn)/Glu-tRNA(Gln) amidotransferase A subunit family amidase